MAAPAPPPPPQAAADATTATAATTTDPTLVTFLYLVGIVNVIGMGKTLYDVFHLIRIKCQPPEMRPQWSAGDQLQLKAVYDFVISHGNDFRLLFTDASHTRTLMDKEDGQGQRRVFFDKPFLTTRLDGLARDIDDASASASHGQSHSHSHGRHMRYSEDDAVPLRSRRRSRRRGRRKRRSRSRDDSSSDLSSSSSSSVSSSKSA